MVKNKYTLYIISKVEIETELPFDEALDEFGNNSLYNFDSTENVTVLDTEWIDSSTQRPEGI